MPLKLWHVHYRSPCTDRECKHYFTKHQRNVCRQQNTGRLGNNHWLDMSIPCMNTTPARYPALCLANRFALQWFVLFAVSQSRASGFFFLLLLVKFCRQLSTNYTPKPVQCTLKIVGQKKCPTFNQHRVAYCPHNYWLKFAQLMLGNQFAIWLGKLNCPSVGNPSDFTQLYNCPTVSYIFSWVTTCPTNFTQ